MKDFIKYFTGLTRNYGVCKINEGYVDPETGKKKFKHEWSQLKVTDKDYEDHLTGVKSIGIQPCTDDGTARFGAIDVDKYPIDREFYLKIIQEKSLPIIPVLSKSGGLHLYVFTTEFVKAIEIRQFLEQMLYVFKLNIKTEIFPKQTNLRSSDEKGNKANGNFINLPYNADGRRALAPDGTEMSLDMFVKCIELNAVSKKQLKDIQEKIISDELQGSGEEFKDGPPCLGVLTKEIMTDDRDRFLYNYMVFAKKKYTDSWQKMVLQAGRKYFSFDEHWTDDHIKSKIKNWEKQKKGFTCTDPLLEPNCMKALCVKRKFGVLAGEKTNYPTLSNLQKINIKPSPEWRVTVENAEENETIQLHCKNTYKLTQVHEFKTVLFEQALIVAPSIKQDQFDEILKSISGKDKIEIIEPAEGTSPIDILKKLLEKHIYGAQATNYMSFESGRPLVEGEFAWFVFDKFFDKLKNEEWKYDAQKTSYMISHELFNNEDKDQNRKVLFGKQKRFPGQDDEGNYFKAIRTSRIPLHIFEKPEEVKETIEIESQENIV